MRKNYFIYNGEQYNEGESIVIKFFDHMAGKTYNAHAKFLYYDTINKEYYVEIYGKKYAYTEDLFYKNLCNKGNPRAPTEKSYNVKNKQYTFIDELNIDGLLIAWIWYIFIMAVGVIFYDRIGIWILASVIFFNYRKRKLKEEGYK